MTHRGTTSRDVSRIVGQNLARLRSRTGLSQQRIELLTARSGLRVPRSTITSMETGRRQAMPIDQVASLASVFGVSIDQLIMDDLVLDGSAVASAQWNILTSGQVHRLRQRDHIGRYLEAIFLAEPCPGHVVITCAPIPPKPRQE